MELSQLLIKSIYLALVFMLVYLILQIQTPLVGMNLVLFSLFISVIVVYFTFITVYNFLINSEIIFKDTSSEKKEKEADEDDADVDENKEKTSITTITKSVNKFVSNHMHKFIEDDVFQ